MHAVVTTEDDIEAVDARLAQAARKGGGAWCMLSSQGELNMATSLVDDEGVDLVFSPADGAVNCQVVLPAGGQEFSPLVASWFSSAGGRVIPPGG